MDSSIHWPVVLVEGWDVMFADNLELFRQRFEPEDLRDDDFELFDYTGQKLELHWTNDECSLKVVDGGNSDQLRNVLYTYLTALGHQASRQETLSALLERASRIDRR